ncbi:MAG: TfoX/Sxy family protein [Acidobacteria bacterium]|nr:TfoX/Sxy family protein [Acidobacteriota bacterium]
MAKRQRNRYLDFVLEQLAPLGRITSRSMFGGEGLYCDGLFFALLWKGEVLYLKVDSRTRANFEARGLKPFRPYPGRPGTLQYYEAPADLFESDGGLDWARGAVAAARAAVDRGGKSSRRPSRPLSR